MLSMALARKAARKLDTYSWSFLSSLARTLAVCRSMASTRFFSSSADRSLGRFNVGEQSFIAFSCRSFRALALATWRKAVLDVLIVRADGAREQLLGKNVEKKGVVDEASVLDH